MSIRTKPNGNEDQFEIPSDDVYDDFDADPEADRADYLYETRSDARERPE